MKKSPRGSTAKGSAVPSQKMALLSGLLGRSRMMQRMAGVQYGGQRDIFAAAGYVPQDRANFAHYWALYTRGDIAGRIVDMPSKTTWRTPPAIVIVDEDEGTPFTEAFNEMAKRLKLWSYFSRVDRLAGVGRYAVLVIGVANVNDQQLSQPLTRVTRPEDIIYLGVYHEDNAQIAEWVTDPGDVRFGLPKTYSLQTSTNDQFKKTGASGSDAKLLIHASRVIHVAEDVLEDDVFGRPRLERPLNRLYDMEKVAASTGEAYWQLVMKILQAKIDPAMEIDDPELKVIDEQLAEMVHDLRRQFTGQGVELSWLPSDTPNVTQVADFYFSLIAGSCGIPKRILFGSELGELASSQDQEGYFGMINERQEAFAEPVILRAFIDRMIAIKALPVPEGGKNGKAGEYQVNWPLLYEESDLNNAETNAKKAAAASSLTPMGGNPRELIRIDADGDIQLVEREPDEPMVLPLPGADPGAAGDNEEAKAARIQELKEQIAELQGDENADLDELQALEDELADLEDGEPEVEEEETE